MKRVFMKSCNHALHFGLHCVLLMAFLGFLIPAGVSCYTCEDLLNCEPPPNHSDLANFCIDIAKSNVSSAICNELPFAPANIGMGACPAGDAPAFTSCNRWALAFEPGYFDFVATCLATDASLSPPSKPCEASPPSQCVERLRVQEVDNKQCSPSPARTSACVQAQMACSTLGIEECEREILPFGAEFLQKYIDCMQQPNAMLCDVQATCSERNNCCGSVVLNSLN
jgi:hypothetical protein